MTRDEIIAHLALLGWVPIYYSVHVHDMRWGIAHRQRAAIVTANVVGRVVFTTTANANWWNNIYINRTCKWEQLSETFLRKAMRCIDDT